MSQAQWVWSDVFAWKNMPWANDRCSKWHLKEPNPDKFTGISKELSWKAVFLFLLYFVVLDIRQ